MERSVVWLQRNLYTVLILFVVGGFVMLLVELLWTGHIGGIQTIAVVDSAVGALLGLIVLFVHGRARTVVAVLFLVLSLSGLVGVFQHFSAQGEEGSATPLSAEQGEALTFWVSASAQDEEENEPGGPGEGAEAEPPPLAPLSLSGLALLGAVTILGMPEKPPADRQVSAGKAAKPRS